MAIKERLLPAAMHNARLWWGIAATWLLATAVAQPVKAGAGVATATTREAAADAREGRDQLGELQRAMGAITKTTMAAGLMASLLVLGSGCSSLPEPPRTDPEGTALNASSSLWMGSSSNGSTSRVRQVSTGPNQFQFMETWYLGGKIILTEGTGQYEPSTKTNIYNYTKPKGIVVVKTEEQPAEGTTTDTVINSTMPLFKVGDRIIYQPRNR